MEIGVVFGIHKLGGNFPNLKNYLKGPLRSVHMAGQSLCLFPLLLPPSHSLLLSCLTHDQSSFRPFPSLADDTHRSVFLDHQKRLVGRPNRQHVVMVAEGGTWSQGTPRLPDAFLDGLIIGSLRLDCQSIGLELLYKPMPRLPVNVQVF